MAILLKMLREKRDMQEAVIYEPKDSIEFSKDNSDFTLIEHGFYAKQIKSCFEIFFKGTIADIGL
jgi:hypothetical protein